MTEQVDRRSEQRLRSASRAPRRSNGYWTQSWRRLRRDPVGVGAGVVLAGLVVVALMAPFISASVTHLTPDHQDLDHVFAGFSRTHLLGSDELGRDTLTRLAYGARVSLGVGFLTVALYIGIGATVGLLAGYYGGLIDHLLMRLVDVILSIPSIYLLILLTSLLPLPVGPPGRPWFVIRDDALSLSVIIASTAWGGVARLVRGEALRLKHREFVLAVQSLGASDFRVMVRHLLPNVLPVVIVVASLGVAGIILVEAALDFIGLGVQPPATSWGQMLSNAQTYFYKSPALVVLPGLAILVTVMAANLFGNAVRDAFDPHIN